MKLSRDRICTGGEQIPVCVLKDSEKLGREERRKGGERKKDRSEREEKMCIIHRMQYL